MTKEQERLQECTDNAITELVYEKTDLQKAYNYYNGKMNSEQYRYLEENFGIGSPTSVEFIPLIKKHVDVLIGEYLGTPVLPKVSCKDSQTISAMEREKQIQIHEQVYKFMQKKLKNDILSFIDGKDTVDHNIEATLQKIIQDVKTNFTSQYEIAAQNVIEYLMQSRSTDIMRKLRELLLDILITGYCFYRVKPSVNRNNVQIEVLNPLNTFIDRNPESPYVKDSYRVVVRKWLSKSQILMQYGQDLSREDVEKIEKEWENAASDYSYSYIRTFEHNGVPATQGLRAGEEAIIPGYPTDEQSNRYNKLLPVYEVEWIETDKNFVMNRYRTVRINDDIYILTGKDDSAVRSIDNPSYCGLTVNGVYFTNRGSQPYSLVLACVPLQDRYNLLHYYRDNIIANSGTVGDWIDESLIPTNLGVNWPERIQKWLAYKKGGLGLIDTSQESRAAAGQAPINTIFNGFDDTVKVGAIQAIQVALQSIEETASSITGVFQERLNGIEQKDAVSNVKLSANNSFTITKQYYQQMDLVTCEMLLDALNEAKIVYKNGLTGTIILGDKFQKVFTALPEHFTLSDYDIHISSSTDVMQDMAKLMQVIPNFIQSQTLAPDIIFEALTSKSLTDLKIKVKQAMEKQKAENNQIQQLQQKLQESQQQLQQMQKQLQQAQKQIEKYDQEKMQLEKERLRIDSDIRWYNARADKKYKEDNIAVDNKKVDIELKQLHDGNPYNDNVNFG